VRDKRVKCDTKTLTTASDAESVERYDEKCRRISLESTSKYCQDRENDAADNLKGGRKRDVSHEECFHSVDPVVEIAIENVSFNGIHCNVVKHTDEVQRCNLDQETHSGLNGEVVVLQRCKV
jgi:hypothetical protein